MAKLLKFKDGKMYEYTPPPPKYPDSLMWNPKGREVGVPAELVEERLGQGYTFVNPPDAKPEGSAGGESGAGQDAEKAPMAPAAGKPEKGNPMKGSKHA